MPELILLAILCLTAMGLQTYLFLTLNQNQTNLIRLLTESNQSLLNQARSKDLATLAGANMMTQTVADEPYVSTEQREMAAYYEAAARAHAEPEFDFEMAEDLENLRSVM